MFRTQHEADELQGRPVDVIVVKIHLEILNDLKTGMTECWNDLLGACPDADFETYDAQILVMLTFNCCQG